MESGKERTESLTEVTTTTPATEEKAESENREIKQMAIACRIVSSSSGNCVEELPATTSATDIGHRRQSTTPTPSESNNHPVSRRMPIPFKPPMRSLCDEAAPPQCFVEYSRRFASFPKTVAFEVSPTADSVPNLIE